MYALAVEGHLQVWRCGVLCLCGHILGRARPRGRWTAYTAMKGALISGAGSSSAGTIAAWEVATKLDCLYQEALSAHCNAMQLEGHFSTHGDSNDDLEQRCSMLAGRIDTVARRQVGLGPDPALDAGGAV